MGRFPVGFAPLRGANNFPLTDSPEKRKRIFKTDSIGDSMDTDPTEVMVLGAIRQGKKSFDKIHKITNIEKNKLDGILSRLEERGYIMAVKKKSWFGTKIEIIITDKGSNELDDRLFEAREKWGQMQQLYQKKDKKGLEQMMDGNRSFLPMMMFFGIMDIMMFSMMFSMMGATMTDYVPAESIPEGVDTGDMGGDAGDAGVDNGFGDGGFGGGDFDFGF